MWMAYVAALGAAVAMAQSGVIARFSGIPAAELTFYRLFIGALCVLLLLAASRQLKLAWVWPARASLVNGVMLASFMLAFLQAITSLSLANAILLVYLAPPISALVAHFLFAERLDRLSSSLIALSFFGFAMLQEFRVDQFHAEQLQGLGYGVLSLLTYTAFLLLNRRPRPEPELQRTFQQLLCGAICVVPFLNAWPIPTGRELGYAMAAGAIPGFLAIYLAIRALRQLPTRVFGTLAYIEPVTVIVAGYLLFDETLSRLQLAGVAVIIIAGMAQAWHHQRQPAVDAALVAP